MGSDKEIRVEVFHWLMLVFVTHGPLLLWFAFLAKGLSDVNNNKTNTFIKKRYMCLSATMCFALFVFLFGVSLPMTLTSNWNARDMTSDETNRKTAAALCLYSFAIFLFLCALCARLWMTYFDIRMSVILKDSRWEKLVHADCEGICPFTYFLMRKKHVFGNFHYIRLIAAVAFVVLLSVDWAIAMYASSVAYFWWEVFYLAMLFGFAAIILWAIPKIQDQLHVFDELKLTFVWGFIFVFDLLLVWVLPLWILKLDALQRSWAYIYFSDILSAAIVSTLTGVMVFYPLSCLRDEKRKVKDMNSSNLLERRMIRLSPIVVRFLDLCTEAKKKYLDTCGVVWSRYLSAKYKTEIVCTAQKCDKKKLRTAIRKGVRGVLSSRDSLSLFAAHLVCEFSLENLIAAIEFVHFKARFDGSMSVPPANEPSTPVPVVTDTMVPETSSAPTIHVQLTAMDTVTAVKSHTITLTPVLTPSVGNENEEVKAMGNASQPSLLSIMTESIGFGTEPSTPTLTSTTITVPKRSSSKLGTVSDSMDVSLSGISSLIAANLVRERWFKTLRDEVAMSDIVFKPKTDVFDVVTALSQRYLVSGADYELNLSYVCRTHIEKVLQSTCFREKTMEDAETELLTLFDDALIEVIRLMHDSFSRWNRTRSFHNYANTQVMKCGLLKK